MNALERGKLARDAVVTLKGQHYPKGIIKSRQPGNYWHVEWPDGSWSRHHAKELRVV